MNEFSLIDKYFKPLATNKKVSQNLEDDVARIVLKDDEELVVSKDVIVEGTHFLKEYGGYKIASKLLLSNLSDLAASGAKPVYYMIGFCKNTGEEFVKEFVLGLKDIQKKFAISLIGGDTIASLDRLFFSVTIFGIAKKNKVLSRKNARKDDLIFVSGNIGSAYLGLEVSRKKQDFQKDNQYYLDQHFFPTPQIKLAQELVKNNLSQCAIDVSDGLLADLQHICNASNLSAVIFCDKIPFHNKLALNKVPMLDLISGGDDYEIIFTAHKKNEKKILQLAKKINVKISVIGNFKKESQNKIILFDKNNKKINFTKYGYQH